MADEYLELLIIARDLASGNVQQAQQKIEQSLGRMRQSARDAERDLSSLDQAEQDVARSAERLSGSLDQSGRSLSGQRQRTGEASQAMSDADRVAQRFESTVSSLTGALDRNTAAHQRSSSAAKQTEQGLAALGATAAKAAGALALTPVALVGVGQAAAGAIGGVVALGAALSQLSALAVALPATMAAAAGSMLAIKSIAGPAIDPVTQALQQQTKLSAPGAATAGGGGAGQAQAQANAARALQQTQIQQGWQMAALQQQLHQLRMTNAQQEAQAQQQLDQARITAVQNVITLERQLHALKESNAAQEQQLEQSLADARASAAEEARTGGDHAAIAAGMVAQAQDNLTQFQQQAQVQQQQAQDAVDQAKVQGLQAVQAAEQNLQQVRIQNAQQLAALQTQIAHTQIQNQWALQSAQQATATAAQATTTAQAAQLALLKSMTPQQLQLYNIITKIKDQWEALTAPGRAAFLGAAINAAQAVQQHLPGIAGVENQFSQQISGVGQDVVRQFSNPQLDARIHGFMSQMARDTGQVGKAIADLLVAFTQFMTAPGTRAFIQWMVDGVSGLGKWALAEEKLLEKHGSLAKFFKSSEGVISNTFRILRDVGKILLDIFGAAAPTGRTLLGSLADFMDHLAKEAGSRSGMAALREFFQKAGPEAVQIAKALVIVAGAVGQLLALAAGAPPVLVGIVWVLEQIAKVPYAGILLGIGVQLALMSKFIPGVGAGLSVIFGWLGKLAAGLLAKVAAGIAELVVQLIGWETIMTVVDATLGVFDALMSPWLLIILAVIAAVVLLYEAWQHNWFGIRDITKNVLGWIKTFITDHWRAILIFLTGGLGALVVLFIDNWDKIKQLFVDTWNFLGDLIHGRWSNILGDVEKIGGDLVAVFGGIWSDIEKGAKTGWNAIISTIGGFVNDMIHIWNWVVKNLQLPSSLKIGNVTWGQSGSTSPTGGGANASRIQPGRGAFAVGGFVPAMPGGVALVSEAGHDELVVTTDPSHRNRSLMLIMEWMERMGLLPKFDIGGWLGSIGSDIAGGAESVWGGVESVATLLGDPIGWIKSHFPHMATIAGNMGQIATSMFEALGGHVEDKLISYATSWIPFLGGTGTGNTKAPFVDPNAGESAIAARAIQIALSQLGRPYVWGGDMPSTGFDCSGLMEFAYRMAGIQIPRTSESQYAAGFPRVPFGQWLPGDLLYSQFPGDGPAPGHVTMYIGSGSVVEAPHTGANVEVAPLSWFTGRGIYVGSNRPAPGPDRMPRRAAGGWLSGHGPRLSAGGWARAVSGMMSTPAYNFGGAYTSLMMTPGGVGPGGRQIHVEIPIYTSQVEADAEYVARTLEMRLQSMP